MGERRFSFRNIKEIFESGGFGFDARAKVVWGL